MHHPIQMKPADSENRNGECHALHAIYYRELFLVAIETSKRKKVASMRSVDATISLCIITTIEVKFDA